jgi:protein-disulfide isomerase
VSGTAHSRAVLEPTGSGDRTMPRLLSTLVTIALVVAALVITGSVLRVSLTHAPRSRVVAQTPEYVDFWEDGLPIASPISGDSTAPVKILILMDLECSACRWFHETLLPAIARRPSEFQVLYIHAPLTRHRFALPAARAAVCAENLGALRPWLDAVYAKQDSLGLRSWEAYAADAGIADTLSLGECARSRVPFESIEAGLEYSSRVNMVGVPTLIVNGWQMTPPLTETALDSTVQTLLGKRMTPLARARR